MILCQPHEFFGQQPTEPRRARSSEVQMVLEIAFLRNPSARVDVDGASTLDCQAILQPELLPRSLVVEPCQVDRMHRHFHHSDSAAARFRFPEYFLYDRGQEIAGPHHLAAATDKLVRIGG